MGVFDWIAQHSDLLQNLGIISGFVFTAYSIRKESRARQIGNMMAAAQQHHSIWKEIYGKPHLSRIIDKKASLKVKALTAEEQMFVTSIVVHLDSVHRAIKAKMFLRQEGLQRDIQGFFSLPIPRAVWERIKPLQDKDFVKFIEACLHER